MEKKLNVKRKHIYRLHRDNDLDHKYGRPAILLNSRMTKSLVWTGTTKIDELNKEPPLTLKLNDNPVYFYGNAIEIVFTKDLTTPWINTETKKPYALKPNEQEALVKKFLAFSELKSPYIKIRHLEKVSQEQKVNHGKTKFKNKKLNQENQVLKNQHKKFIKENEKLKNEIKNLKEKKEKLKIINQNLMIENKMLNSENQILKPKSKIKKSSDYTFE